VATSQRQYVSPLQHALAPLGLGNLDETIGALERGVDIRAVDLAAVAVDPRFAGLTSEPRFKTVLRRMNLP
jgi:adenylate cyclase